MKNRWCVLLVLAFCLALASCNDETPTDGDTDDGLPITAACTSDSACNSKLCYPFSDNERACSTTCTSHTECSTLAPGSCCQKTVQDQNICFPPALCEIAPDGDNDNDQEITESNNCDPDDTTCFGNRPYKCNSERNWEALQEDPCTDSQICINGTCQEQTDGDDDQDTEQDGEKIEPIYECGDPCGLPSSTTRKADDPNFFIKESSNPSELADIYTINTDIAGMHSSFDDNVYVKLTLDDGPLDENDNVQELFFTLDIDTQYKYDITIDYVCGPNWGEASLFIDDQLVLREDGSEFVDLNCLPGGGFDEMPLKKIAYKTVCLDKSVDENHELKIRVVGKKSTSNGYSIGVDYFFIMPSVEYKDQNCDPFAD